MKTKPSACWYCGEPTNRNDDCVNRACDALADTRRLINLPAEKLRDLDRALNLITAR